MSSYKSMKAMSWHQVAVHVVVQEQEAVDWKCIHPKVTLASVENVAQSRDSSHPRVAAYVHR